MDGLQLGNYLLMGAAAAAASGPDSTAAALPFSTNLVVSIVVALHFFTSQLAAGYQITRAVLLLLLARKGRRCRISSL